MDQMSKTLSDLTYAIITSRFGEETAKNWSGQVEIEINMRNGGIGTVYLKTKEAVPIGKKL